jgi:Flp pilus assembly protein TadG
VTLGPTSIGHGDGGVLGRLLRDTAGNTLAIIAAALIPLLAIVGGGVDVSRGYLAQSRLQQACDAGVLAARKRIGSSSLSAGMLPQDANKAGHQFFDVNFGDGIYGTEQRSFGMTVDEQYAVNGTASVVVPTTVMSIFGFTEIPLDVSCQARLNFSNTDVMMVLDVTGSMAGTNPGDSEPKIDALKDTVRAFYAQIAATAAPDVRLRFGFVPYSTNVNVGALLDDSWVNSSWTYDSRQQETVPGPVQNYTYNRNWVTKSGSVGAANVVSTYPATIHQGSPGSTYVDQNENVVTIPASGTTYSCDQAAPKGSYSANTVILGTSTAPFAGPPSGTQTIQQRRLTENGTNYYLGRSGDTCYVYSQTYNTYVREYEQVTEPRQSTITQFRYKPYVFDMSDWRSKTAGCIEERATYEITDYDNVDLTRALDLDIDLVPDGSARTMWSPLYPDIIYERSLSASGTGSFTVPETVSTATFLNPKAAGLAACPAPARALAPMSSSELESYLATLTPNGTTYHDIGMIWGGRLISPTGLFRQANADINGQPTRRNLIFLTDGMTETSPKAYSPYGVEPLDQRRWQPTSALTLNQVVEKRFGFACSEVKKRNVAVWVVGFGTSLSSVMTECAGPGHYFEADNNEELGQVFADIARRMGDLRISK